MSGRGSDHRKCERVPFREEILVDGVKVTSSDISEGGIFVSSMLCYELGKVVRVVIPSEGGPIEVRAIVTFCEQGIGMGLQYIHLSTEQKTRIRELLDRIT